MKQDASRRATAWAVPLLMLCALPWIAAAVKAEDYQRGEFRFAVAPAASWIEPQTVAAQWDEKRLPSAGTRVRSWLYDSQYLRTGGQRERYLDYAYEATSPAMLTEVGKVEIDFRPDFERLTIHEISVRRDRAWLSRLKPEAVTLARRETEFERDMALGSVSAMIVLDDVRLGDVVRVRYTVQGHNPIMAGLDHVSGSFALTSALRARQLRVLFDADAQVTEHRDAAVTPARVTRGPRQQEWRYRAEAVAAVVPEDRNPQWFSPYPQVQLAEKRGWGDVADWARALYPEPAPLPADLRQRIAQWRALPDAQARIAAALLAVQEDVRYFGVEIGDNTHKPREPAQVWEQRRGDCKDKSRLLVAILAALDIEAHPALVSAGNGKSVAHTPPSASAFDHVIVQVRSDKGLLWLDPTRTGQRGPALAQEVSEFGFALPVAEGVRALAVVTPNPASGSRTRVVQRYLPQPDADAMTMEVRAEYTGAAANSVRNDLRYSGSEAVARRYADYYRRRHAALETLAPLQIDDDAAANRLVLTERYRIGKPWSASTAGQRALDIEADSIAGLLVLPASLDRRTPLAVAFPSDVSHRVELALPAGWRWTGSAEQRELDDAAAQYRYRVGIEKDTLFSEESVLAREAAVPVERMAAHLDWRRAAREQNLQRWIVALPDGQADAARKARLNDLFRGVINDNKKAKTREND